MKRATGIALTTIAFFAVLATGVSQAADVSAGVELNSAYVWRGMTLNDGTVLQPEVLLEKDAFELFLWGNINIDDYDGTLQTDEFSEIDIDVSYGVQFPGLDVRLGFIQYLYPNDGSMISTNGESIVQSGTAETYAKLSRKLGAGLSVNLNAYYDFDEVKDGYGKLVLQHDGSVGEVLVTTGASIAIAGRATTETGEDGLQEYEVFMKMAYFCESGLGISGRIAITDTADKDVLPEQDTNLYGGVGLKYIF